MKQCRESAMRSFGGNCSLTTVWGFDAHLTKMLRCMPLPGFQGVEAMPPGSNLKGIRRAVLSLIEQHHLKSRIQRRQSSHQTSAFSPRLYNLQSHHEATLVLSCLCQLVAQCSSPTTTRGKLRNAHKLHGDSRCRKRWQATGGPDL